jgi:DNA-binding beta-propeller fold protein YncE
MGGASIGGSRSLWLLATAIVASVLAVALLLATGGGTDPDRALARDVNPDKKTVLMVGNNWDGTVDVINPRTFERIDRLDLAKDYRNCVESTPPGQAPACTVNNEFASEGNPQLVDDVRVAPSGRRLYVSRPSLGDVAAFRIRDEKLLWRVDVSGERSDHMAMSPDGEELIVSSTVDNRVNVIDTSEHRIVDNVITGDFPHENEYSENGKFIFNGTIGRVIAPDDPELDAGKGLRNFTIADAETHEVKKQVTIGNQPLGLGIRPFHVMPNNRIMYVQLSFFHGFWEYDLREEKVLRKKHLPLNEVSRPLEREDYPLDSAHHGIALNGSHSKICNAGTVSDYVAIVNRQSFRTERIIDVGKKPYWATTSGDGRRCFISNSDSDNVSVISYGREREIERFPVGDHPQRMRIVHVRSAAIGQ